MQGIMAENLEVSTSKNKIDRYETLLPQVKSLLQGEENLIANMANVCAALKETMNFFWVGFYLVDKDELVLGPFQGPIACTRIKKGKGVCGTSWLEKKSIIVPNVDDFPGHIACSSLSRSEIVIPGKSKGDVIFILDVDSDKVSDFDEHDERYLTMIVNELSG